MVRLREGLDYTDRAATVLGIVDVVSQLENHPLKEGWENGWLDGAFLRLVGAQDLSIFSDSLRTRLLEVMRRVVLIPAGEFMMGSDDGEDREKPIHKVKITRPFLLLKYPVTRGLWESVMGNNPCYGKGATRPVEHVSWCDLVLYCNKLSQMEGLEEVYRLPEGLETALEKQTSFGAEEVDELSKEVKWNRDANGYRLPTEAEWEYAAKAGANFTYSGSNNPDEVGWYDDNSGSKTHPVGEKKPNGFGLYDMSGNVWELCYDTYDSEVYSSRESGVEDPLVSGGEASYRVGRGGSWRNGAENLRCAYRYKLLPGLRYFSLGGRICRNLST